MVEPLSVSVPTWISVSVTPRAVAPLAFCPLASAAWHTFVKSPNEPLSRRDWLVAGADDDAGAAAGGESLRPQAATTRHEHGRQRQSTNTSHRFSP